MLRGFAKLPLRKRYILSFAITSIVPIILIMILLFIPVNNLFRTEAMKADAQKSKQLRDIMDIRTTEIYNIAAQMSLDVRVREFLYAKSPLDNIGNYYISDVLKVVNSYGTGNNFISFIAIYFKNGSIVVTNEGKYKDEYFFKNVLKYEGIEPTVLKEFMSQTHYNKSIPLSKISSDAPINGNYVTYIQSIPIGEKNAAANIMILVEEKNMIANTGEIDLENKEQIMIINNDGKIMFSNGRNETLKQEYIDKILSSNNSRTYNFTENGKGFENSFINDGKKGFNAIISYAKSNVNDWTYVVISNINTTLLKVNKIRNLSIGMALLTLLFAAFLSFIMGRASYSPWNKLTNYISTLNNGKDGKYGNEYQFTRGTIEDLVLAKEKLEHDMVKNNSYLLNQMLLNICTGKSISTEVEKVELVLPYKSLIAIAADFEGEDDIKDRMCGILCRWARMFLQNCKVFAFTDGRKGLCIVLNTDPRDSASIINKINSHKEKYSKHFNIIIYAGAGNSYFGIDKLYDSYSEAKKALEYCYIKDNTSVVFFPDLERHIFSSLNLPVHSGNPLLNSVKVGDYKTCSKLLNEYFKDIIDNAGDASIIYMYCLFYNFVSVILKACDETSIDFISVFGKSPEQVLDIDKYRNSKQMIESVYKLYMTLCEYVQVNKTSQNSALKREVEKTVSKNYMNQNFSLIALADHLGYSSSYLSRFINQEFGIGFGEMLNNARLDKAKTLLLQGTRNISDISQEIGYSSTNSFIRVFKRIEGITPKQFREMS